MVRAQWNGEVIAESEKTIMLENYHYFPSESVKMEFLKKSELQTTCQWKGRANYYHIVVGEHTLNDGAWTYPEPSEKAAEIKGYIAFWKGVLVR